MDTVGDDRYVLNLLEIRDHVKSCRTRIHKNGVAASYERCSLSTYGILKIHMCDGSDHIVLAAVGRHLVRKLYSAVKSHDRALTLKCSDISSDGCAGNAKPCRKDGRIDLALFFQNIQDLFSSVRNYHSKILSSENQLVKSFSLQAYI